MKIWFKYLGYILVITTILVIVVILAWHREQNINFLSMLPETINYCDKEIKPTNKAYVELAHWVENNENGWKNTLVSYIPNTIFKSELISINILEKSVVINYSNNGIDWNQVIKGKQENELLLSCKNS